MTDPRQPEPGQPRGGDEDRALAGEYALGLLSAPEAAAFEARLVHEPGLRALYASWAEDFAALTDDIPEVTPPAALTRAIEARLFAPTPRRGRLALGWLVFGWLGAGVAVVALALWVGLGVDMFTPRAPDKPAYVAQIAAEDGSLMVAASYDAKAGALFVDRRAGAAPAGRALELWLIVGDAAPVSLGVLPEAQQGALPIAPELRARLSAGAVFAISDEPEGGSPTGAPTGAVLASGAITAS